MRDTPCEMRSASKKCAFSVLFYLLRGCRVLPARGNRTGKATPVSTFRRFRSSSLAEWFWAAFFEQLPICRPLPDVTGRIRSLPSCPETSFWPKWTVRSGIAGVVDVQNTCVEVPCTGRDVKPVPGPCGGPCSGTYNAGFTNGPENVGVTQKNYTFCWGGNNGVGGGCPCQKHECSIAP